MLPEGRSSEDSLLYELLGTKGFNAEPARCAGGGHKKLSLSEKYIEECANLIVFNCNYGDAMNEDDGKNETS
jgi:hypothetical protein